MMAVNIDSQIGTNEDIDRSDDEQHQSKKKMDDTSSSGEDSNKDSSSDDDKDGNNRGDVELVEVAGIEDNSMDVKH